MEYCIVSNNKKAIENFPEAIKVEGEFIDVLYKARDMVHKGHRLISYPLGASIRMMYSPIRSIVISKEPVGFHEDSLEIIEGSIEKYKVTMGERNVDNKNYDDYQMIDYELLLSAIEESIFMKNMNK